MRALRIRLPLLIAALSTGCTSCPSSPVDDVLDASVENGCQDFLDYDGGAVGTAGQVLPLVTNAVNAWKPDLVMTGLVGKLSPNGTDVDGGWTFTYGSPTITGLATVQPFATHTIVAGDCDYQSNEPSIRDFHVDSNVALAIAVDAGCVLASIVPVSLVGIDNHASPLYNIAPAWLINASVKGVEQTCVVNADTGAFGLPVDGGAGDGG